MSNLEREWRVVVAQPGYGATLAELRQTARTGRALASVGHETSVRLAHVQAEGIIATDKVHEINHTAREGVTDYAMLYHYATAASGGDPGLLERLAGNLVENAIRHNVRGGEVSITIEADHHEATLEVANTGQPIDPEQVADLIEPFKRAGQDRTRNGEGVGLGLSIVDAIVAAHRGTMMLVAPDEGGLRVRVRLPMADTAGSRHQRTHDVDAL